MGRGHKTAPLGSRSPGTSAGVGAKLAARSGGTAALNCAIGLNKRSTKGAAHQSLGIVVLRIALRAILTMIMPKIILTIAPV